MSAEKQRQPGALVTYAGFAGVVVRVYINGKSEAARMYEVRLASGLTCVCGSDLTDRKGAT